MLRWIIETPRRQDAENPPGVLRFRECSVAKIKRLVEEDEETVRHGCCRRDPR
jgi:hypothetical protein